MSPVTEKVENIQFNEVSEKILSINGDTDKACTEKNNPHGLTLSNSCHVLSLTGKRLGDFIKYVYLAGKIRNKLSF